ncbi:PTS system mannose/fructose/sorbose family transporter subunit IID [Jeotgalibaca ciconiae]|nr:PTS system mannose/fructose/sorbose family transporter subunit IID [Jeotgalibaca ciconiae]
MPKLLPAVITILVYYLIKKRNWNVYKLLALLIVLGITLSYVGVLI